MYNNHESSEKQYCRYLIEKIVKEYSNVDIIQHGNNKKPEKWSYKFVIDKRRFKQDGIYPIKLRIFQNTKYKEKTTGIQLEEKYWDEKKQEILNSAPNYEKNNTRLLFYKNRICQIAEEQEETDTRIEEIANKIDSYERARINIFTLPSTNFILEKELCKFLKVNLICAEKDTKVFKKQNSLNIFTELKETQRISLFNKDAFEVLRNPRHNYAVIWLDLCGGYNVSTINNILSLVQQRNLNKLCYVAITLMNKREQKAKEISKFYGYKTISQFRDNFHRLVIDFAEMIDGRKCRLINSYSYNNSSPMTMQIFEIKTKN